MMNVSRVIAADQISLAGACDILPCDFQDPGRISVDSFLPDDLYTLIAQYFAMDLTLYRIVQRMNATRSDLNF